MFVEVAVGMWTNSLGLIGDAGHMFFDNSALFVGLYATFVSHWHPDKTFTYGYGRGEVLAAFVNSILLVFIGISLLMEAVERFVDPPQVHQDYLIATAVWGFLINMVGLFVFHDHSHGGLSGMDGGGCHGHSHGGNHNMRSVFLHILADALGSLSVIVSSILIHYKQWYIADPICSAMISLLIMMSALPLTQQTGTILLQQLPADLTPNLARYLQKVRLPPAAGCLNAQLTPGPSIPLPWRRSYRWGVLMALSVCAWPTAGGSLVRCSWHRCTCSCRRVPASKKSSKTSVIACYRCRCRPRTAVLPCLPDFTRASPGNVADSTATRLPVPCSIAADGNRFP